MKKLALAFAAAATIGLSVPAFAYDGQGRVRVAEDFHVRIGDGHRGRDMHRGWDRRHHRHCDTFWRHGRRVTVCR